MARLLGEADGAALTNLLLQLRHHLGQPVAHHRRHVVELVELVTTTTKLGKLWCVGEVELREIVFPTLKIRQPWCVREVELFDMDNTKNKNGKNSCLR